MTVFALEKEMSRRLKREWFIGILLIVLTLITALTWGNSDINNAANVISALSALGTFFIAILLYNRFSISQKLLDRQLEKVTELVDLLYALESLAFFNIRDQSLWGIYSPSINTTYHNVREGFLNKNILVTRSYTIEMSKMRAIAHNPLTPKVIADKLRPLCVDIMDHSTGTESLFYADDYCVIEITKNNPIQPVGSWEVGKLNGQDITVEKYLENWYLFLGQIKGWLEDKSKESGLELNT